eukprot:11043968-Lingulodinium_polyedra.AAC.1
MPSRPLRWPNGPATELSCSRRLGRSSTTTAHKMNPISGPTQRLPRTSQGRCDGTSHKQERHFRCW